MMVHKGCFVACSYASLGKRLRMMTVVVLKRLIRYGPRDEVSRYYKGCFASLAMTAPQGY